MEKELLVRLESFNELSLEIDLVLTLARNRLGPESTDIIGISLMELNKSKVSLYELETIIYELKIDLYELEISLKTN